MPSNDLISRAALGIGRCNPDVFNNRAYGEGWNACIAMIEAAPTVDAVPVVLCEDCKHWDNTSEWRCFCEKLQFSTTPKWFCADGEKRGEA